MHRFSPLAVLFLGCFVAPPAWAAAPAEVKNLHVLLVFDTNSDLEESLVIDEQRLTRFLVGNFPEGRHTVTVLKGADVTRDKVLAHYKKLAAAPDDGLFFFYGGHGATDTKVGHYFQLKNGPALVRSELRRAMEAKKTNLVVMLTDCCSTPVKLPPRKLAGKRPTPPEMVPAVIGDLFYRTRGTVDVTAATDGASWCDLEFGGIFTRTLTRQLDRPVEELDRNGDGMVTWDEFFPQLQSETERTFASWKRDMKQRGEKVEANGQRPRAFTLPRAAAPAAPVTPAQAVVSLENGTEKPLEYRTRWGAEGAWTEWASLAPEGRAVIATPVTGKEAPQLHIEFKNRRGTARLTARLYTGTGRPTFEDGEPAKIRFKK